MELYQDAILDLLVPIETGSPITQEKFDAALKALKYYQTVSSAAHKAFDVLAKDNTYGPGPNAAWKILGEALSMISSTDEPQ